MSISDLYSALREHAESCCHEYQESDATAKLTALRAVLTRENLAETIFTAYYASSLRPQTWLLVSRLTQHYWKDTANAILALPEVKAVVEP